MTQYGSFMKLGLLEMCKNDIYNAFQILRACNVPILIAERKRFESAARHLLLLDIRHLPEIQTRQSTCLYWIIDGQTGKLIFQTRDKKKMPKLSYQRNIYKGLKARLSDILQLPHKLEHEPQSLEELNQLIDHHDMASVTSITYMISIHPLLTYTWYTGKNRTGLVAPFSGHAYPKSNLDIGYCFPQAKHGQQQKMPILVEEQPPTVPEPSSTNLRGAVSVKVKGLRLAYELGLITMEEMKDMSHALSTCIGAMWITCDDEKHPRFITYKDSHLTLDATILCDSKASDDVWLKLLESIRKRANVVRLKKTKILNSLLEKLNFYRGSKLSSLWTLCQQQLEQVIYMHQVYLFCPDDTLLHLMKTPLAGFCDRPSSKGVFLRTVGDNSIGSLSGLGLQFINLAYYFNYGLQVYAPGKDDELLWKVCQDWLPADGQDCFAPWTNPNLRHGKRCNQKYPMILETPMPLFLKQRNKRNAQAVLDLYSQFAAFNVKHFGYDVTTLGQVSLSKMAFDITWLEYAKQAGPMAHPVEKIHPHIEHLLRPWCKGGFSFSCRDFLESDSPMEEGKENAASIREFDLSSAYGASASTMATARGFGHFFLDNVVSNKRWKFFEYRAAMYTLYKWIYVDKKRIKSVFSNYSPLGLFYIGKYPIDLVAIMQDGSVELIQFDGHYVHGDYNNPTCPSLLRYVGNTTRQQCEDKTKLRDQDTINWMTRVQGHNISYKIITDCCHKDYSTAALTHAFETIPELASLVAGIANVRSKNLDSVNFATTTFIAQVVGHTTVQSPNGSMGPVFNLDGSNFKDAFKSSGTMLLTSDYYQYLKKFGFCVDNVDWVIFYQRCFDLPRVFKKLVDMRTMAGPAKNAFIKSLINMACGYFGLNSNKGCRSMVRISHRLPKMHSTFKHHIVPLSEFKGKQINLITTVTEKKINDASCMPLILFTSVIEYGKMMLNRALMCMQKHLNPKAFRLLYCNVDNLIIASSVNDLGDATLDSTIFGYINFQQEFEELLGDGPGLLKQEWCITSDEKPWKFVSPGRMHYCISHPRGYLNKSCLIKGVSPPESFSIAMDLLNKTSFTVNQTQTINRLAGIETRIVQYKFQNPRVTIE